ncbi:MAG TPA: family 1 glycosylhydrolase, partial [Roseiflexaceae bacterium]|nr:family 1 glycosylhydrolase [Roseiflexaceae bacterium]
FDWSWIDQVLDYMVRDLRIQPIVDLMHYGTPLWLEDSFAVPDYPERVAAYAGAFAARYGELVRYYTPLNEPIVNADFCGRRGVWPPYLAGDRGFVRVLLPIARGIQLSAQAIRATDPDAILVAVEAINWHRAATPGAQAAATWRDQADFLCWDLVRGTVDAAHPLHGWLLEHGASESQLAALRSGATEQELFGVNFYPWSAHVLIEQGSAIHERQAPRDGGLLLDVLRRCHAHVGRPLLVTETSAREDIDGRAAWMDETIAAVRAARAEGLPVIGYTWFPLVTMVEWEYRTSERSLADHLLHLGLWDSHFDEQGILVRHETPLVGRYRGYASGVRI